jgi:hypothetical protein
MILPDFKFLNNLNNDSSNGLPLHKAMVGRSDFKILIDSGANTCYVHPKLLSYALSATDVKDQAVETAYCKQSNINKKITFRMFLGEHQEIVLLLLFLNPNLISSLVVTG